MKKLILLIIILALALGLFALQMTIGTGDQINRYPLASYFGYVRSADLYMAEEIGDQSISISSVAWYSQIATTAAVPTKIYLKTTTASTLYESTWAYMIHGATLLYDQTQTGTVAGGWNTFTLGSSFDLPAGQNLLILVERNFGGTGSGAAGGDESNGPQIHATWGDPDNAIHRSWESDNSPPAGYDNGHPVFNRLRPNVRLGYTVDAPLDELFIGTGTATSRCPLGSCFGYERSAALYTAAEIGAQNISISSVAWYATQNTTAAVPIKIYLKRSSAGILTRSTWANMINGATLVWNDTRVGLVANSWNMFNLNNTFNLATGENLIVMVETNYGADGAGDAGGDAAGGKIKSTPTNQAHLVWFSDNAPPVGNGDYDPNYRPNLRLSCTVTPEELAIGDGRSTQRFPLGSYYGYERSAAVYTASEIGGQNISISSVAWFATQNTTAAVPTKIYLKRTSANTLTADTWANMISDATLLYDDRQSGLVANTWNRFELNSTFNLAMGDNLLVLVERNYGGGGAGSFGGSSDGGRIHSTLNYDTHLTWWADTSPPDGNNNGAPGLRPNLKLYYKKNIVTPRVLPLTEDWSSGTLVYNKWTKESENWETIFNLGSPAPSARFDYSPHLANYSSALSSRDFDARGVSSVNFSFDLLLDNDNDSVENVMSWQIWNGNTWITLGSYSSLNGDLPWTHYSYDVSAHASNRIFKIRYLASGEQTFHINRWLIDNIYLGPTSSGLGQVTNLVISKIGTSVNLDWSAVPGASWYRIYDSQSPNGPFIPRGSVPSQYLGTNLGGAVHSKRFYRVTAGNGPMPSGPRLDNTSVSSPNLISQPNTKTNPNLNKSKPSKGLGPN